MWVKMCMLGLLLESSCMWVNRKDYKLGSMKENMSDWGLRNRMGCMMDCM